MDYVRVFSCFVTPISIASEKKFLIFLSHAAEEDDQYLHHFQTNERMIANASDDADMDVVALNRQMRVNGDYDSLRLDTGENLPEDMLVGRKDFTFESW